MKVAPAVPAVARLWIVEVPILAWLSMWKAIEKPSMRLSNSGPIASGVHVAAGKAGAACGIHSVDADVGDPAFDDDSDRVDVVGDDLRAPRDGGRPR